MYDFANQPFTTLIITFIYSTYFVKAIAPDEIIGTVLWSRGITITAIVVALISPLMGAIADQGGYRKLFLIFWTWVCIIGSFFSFYAVPGEITKALFWVVLANIGFEMGGVFCNAYLPHIAPKKKIGRISGYGWSFGYVGGLISLVIVMVLLVNPEAPAFGFSTQNGENIRAANLLAAIWFAVFSIPTFLWVKDKPISQRMSLSLVRSSYAQVKNTFREIKKYKQTCRFLIARILYNDGLITIFSFGGIYAAGTFDFTFNEIMIFGIVLNVTAGLGAFMFGFLDDKIGGKNTVQLSNIGLIIACTIAVLVPNRELFNLGSIAITGRHFFWLAGILIGICSGPNQASSRSLMSRFTPKNKQNEFFGFFAFSGKATAFIGPFLLGVLTAAFGSQRFGVAVVAVLVLLGAIVLHGLDEDEGARESLDNA
jgi:UMF1 family MFS transporter